MPEARCEQADEQMPGAAAEVRKWKQESMQAPQKEQE